MDDRFWEQKWVNNETGWHQPEFNQLLTYFWKNLNIQKKSKVLVPLCGKSKDMVWLRDQGHPVVGVELSPIACSAFFLESHLKPEMALNRNFQIYKSDDIQLYCGDFFKIQKEDLVDVEAVYDRASYIALPPELRKRYAMKMSQLLDEGSIIMLHTIEFNSDQGPPFSITQSEIIRNWGLHFTSNLVHEDSIDIKSKTHTKNGIVKGLVRVHVLKRKPE